MTITEINETSKTRNLFTLFDPINKKFFEAASKVKTFVNDHKATIFFGTTLAIALFAHPQSLACLAVAPVMISGMLTACVLQTFATLYGAKGLANKDVNNAYSFLLGGINLCTSYLYPQAAAAVGVCNLGVKGCAYLFQRFTNLNTVLR